MASRCFVTFLLGVAPSSLVAQHPAESSHSPSAPDTAPKPETAGDPIIVNGRRPVVRRTSEGATYDVRDNARGQAGSAADVLGTLPSVGVSPDGAVAVRGDANVQVYVNGRPSAAMTGEGRAAALEAMSGSSIASVELITNPSARYDSNGGTIVNLVLKSGQSEGLHGQATANAGDHGRKGLSVNATYGAGKISASVNASLRDNVRFTHIRDDRRILASDGSTAARFLTESDYTPTHAQSASLNASLAYAIAADASLGMDLGRSRGSPKNRVFERHFDDPLGPGADTEYRRVRGGTYVNGSHDLSIYYDDRGRAGGATLKITGQHGGSSLRADRLFTTFHDLPPAAASGERVLSDTLTRFDRAAVDHERSIGGGWRIGIGAEWKSEFSRFDNGRTGFDPSSQLAIGSLARLAITRFEAVGHSGAVYASLQLKTGPWTLQAGERFELLRIRTQLFDDTAANARHYRRLGGFNHNLSAARELGRDQLVLRLSRGRQRFDVRDLNPARIYVDAQNLYSGNPQLAPQSVTRSEAEYGFARGRGEGAATLYYRRTDRTIADYTRLLSDNVLFTSKRNGGRSQSLGGQLTYSGALGKAITYSLTGNAFWSQLSTAGEAGNRSEALFSYSAQASLDWKLSSRDKLHLDANLQGPSLVPQGRRSGVGAANLVWRRVIRPKWTLSMSAQGLVQKWRVHSVVRTLDGLDINDRRNGGRSAMVGIAYTFR